MTINCRVANVTPDQALIWLGSVRNQSNINRRQVNAYAEDISAGRWKLNGEPIVISQNGVVLSGRLRLLACAASKASFPSLIVEGVQNFSFESFNSVRRRTTGDILTIRNETHGRALAAALGYLWRYGQNDFDKWAKRPPTQALLQILEENPEIRTSLVLTKDIARVLPHGVACALHFLFSCVDSEKAVAFFAELHDPSADTDGPPAKLRRQMEELVRAGGSRIITQTIGLTIRAWEAFRSRRQVSVLRYAPGRESFPQITDLPSNLFVGVSSHHNARHSGTSDIPVSDTQLRAEVIDLTPEIAEAYLDRNDGNRSIAYAVVEKYARDILAGRWVLNGQTIKIGANRRLLDGQHRCHAVIKAGKPVRTLVVSGLDETVFDTFDLGARRSFSDILIDKKEQNSSTLAAALRQLWLIENGFIQSRNVAPTVSELLEMLDRHPNIRASVRHAHKIRDVIATSYGCALHYLFSSVDAPKAEQFFEGIVEGDMLPFHSPILRLRNQLLKDRASKKRAMSDSERIAITIKAWNAHLCDTSIATLKWQKTGPRKESFPRIAKLELPCYTEAA